VARKARLRIPGLPLHVVQRGINRESCFLSDSDRLVYLSLVEKRAPTFECAMHAFVLMTNHVHLLLTPARVDSASMLMKHVGQEYVQYFNRTHARSGSLWEGRFHSSIVDTERYLLRCHRYVELNPVRAGMVSGPGEYAWSSYQANAWGRASSLIEPHPVYLALGGTPGERIRAYQTLFAEAITQGELDEIRHAVNGGFVLGSEAFRDLLSETAGRPVSRRRRSTTTACRGPYAKAE
jgi:putative transposase